MDTELKPCPFCGEEAGICEASDICFHRDDDGNKIFGGWRCFCPSCAIEQVGYETREEAVSAWNNRSTEHATHRAPVDEKGGGRMTGIERLRELARSQNMDNAWTAMLAHELCDIADQIELEHDAEVADSPYDAIRPEDRDAIAWVRYHGGRDEVRMELDNLRGAIAETCARLGVERSGDLTADAQGIWRAIDRLKSLLGDSVPRAAYERRLARRQRQIDESHAALRRRLDAIARLASENDALCLECAQMRPRLMPDGMCWPVFEDGEPVRIGDEVDFGGEGGAASSVELQDDGHFVIHACDGAGDYSHRNFRPGEHVKRPAPKVYDADRVEIREGDTVYGFAGQQYEVTGLCEYEPSIVHAKTVGNGVAADELLALSGQLNSAQLEASKLTHRAPVLAADGRPLRVGETVWLTDGSERHVVLSTEEDGIGSIVTEVQAPGAVKVHISPSRLTHERPESWERIEEDKGLNPFDYCKQVGHKLWTFDNAEEFKASDLVRRCRALAERDAK